MNDQRIGALVLDNDATAGIFTERDVLVRIVALGLDPATTRIRDVMPREPVTIRSCPTACLPAEGAHLRRGLPRLRDRNLRHRAVQGRNRRDRLIHV